MSGLVVVGGQICVPGPLLRKANSGAHRIIGWMDTTAILNDLQKRKKYLPPAGVLTRIVYPVDESLQRLKFSEEKNRRDRKRWRIADVSFPPKQISCISIQICPSFLKYNRQSENRYLVRWRWHQGSDRVHLHKTRVKFRTCLFHLCSYAQPEE